MTKEDLQNSITLIGPSCVGKSLLASNLAEKLNMKYVCIDDLLVMIEYEKLGWISPSKKLQQEFKKRCAENIAKDPLLRRDLKDFKTRERQAKLINEFVDLYNYYNNLLHGLKSFYKPFAQYQRRMVHTRCEIERIANLNIVASEITSLIFEKVEGPLVFDMPATFGWKTKDSQYEEDLRLGELARETKVDIETNQNFIDRFLKTTSTVLLYPGEDYNKRNTARQSKENNLILRHLDYYYDNAVTVISTNGIFHQPENKYMQQRTWLNAKESLVKESLKNQSEINNICDQIIMSLQDIKQT